MHQHARLAVGEAHPEVAPRPGAPGQRLERPHRAAALLRQPRARFVPAPTHAAEDRSPAGAGQAWNSAALPVLRIPARWTGLHYFHAPVKWWVGAIAIALMCSASARAGPVEEAALRALLSDPRLRGARTGALVADLWTGETLAATEPEHALVPASNQKLLISVAAFEHWGPTHRFETPLYAEALEDGVVTGPLWIEGRGDPSLVSERLWSLAEELRLRGVRAIPDGLALDPSYFAGAAQHPDWHPLAQRAYEAPTAAFAANYSTFRVEVAPAREPGALARLELSPHVEYFRIRPEARTVRGPGRLTLGIAQLADASGERVYTAGSVAAGAAPDSYWRPVSLPERYAASVLRLQLESAGIRVGPGLRFGVRPTTAKELLRFQGAPVSELIALLNKYSNNFIAEQLLKCLGAELYGAPGTWDKGARALESWLVERGIGGVETAVADGSGLSARNRVAPATFVALLRRAARDPDWGPEFLASLPLGGRDGTLRERNLADRSGVRAKTGHLRAVSALSGLLPGPDGRALVFSVIVNGARRAPADVDAALDEFVSALGVPRAAQRISAND
jgi:D-alanyl-D-alanine carboxypeptidase/D-alanyl-D-alanine-endopeptidase (penicillin-binding protein 4)